MLNFMPQSLVKKFYKKKSLTKEISLLDDYLLCFMKILTRLDYKYT